MLPLHNCNLSHEVPSLKLKTSNALALNETGEKTKPAHKIMIKIIKYFRPLKNELTITPKTQPSHAPLENVRYKKYIPLIIEASNPIFTFAFGFPNAKILKESKIIIDI